MTRVMSLVAVMRPAAPVALLCFILATVVALVLRATASSAAAHAALGVRLEGVDPPAASPTNAQLALLAIYMALLAASVPLEVAALLAGVAADADPPASSSSAALREKEDGGADRERGGGMPTTARAGAGILAALSDARASLRMMVLFGTVILLFYLADGAHDWRVSAGPRMYDRDLFVFVCLVFLVIGALTLRPSASRAPLHREQTEEWKGCMQLAFILYHYFAAKEIYNLIRVFIAAYVWLTGYGNFAYFAATGDYSFVRLCKMLLRLNLLVAVVAVALNRPFMLYYVCPLHTFYFLTVYVHMAVFSSRNAAPAWMRVKFAVHFAVLAVLFDVPGVFEVTWAPFTRLLSYEGSLHEWRFRAALDHYACLAGMLAAYHYPAAEAWRRRLEEGPPARCVAVKCAIAAVTAAAVAVWAVAVLQREKYEYNAWHPYTSFIPITAFVILRNIMPVTRAWVVGCFQWTGRITLETYIAQFHLWLVDDAKSRLVLLGGYPLLNFVLCSAVFMFASVILFEGTTALSDALIPRGLSARALLTRTAMAAATWTALCAAIQMARGADAAYLY